MKESAFKLGMLVLMGTLVLGSCNFLQVADKPDDQVITTEIQAKLFADPVLKTRDIRVSSNDGVVMVSGTVATELEKAAVVRLANQANGVKQVVDQLSISSESTEAAAPEEAEVPKEAAPTRMPAAKQPKPPRRAEPGAQPAPAKEPTEVAQSAPAPALEPSAQPAEAAAPPPPEPETFTLPAGTVITVRMIDEIDSSRHRAGEEFAATVDAPVAVGDRVVVPRGSDARVRLIEVQSAGRMKGRSDLQVELVGVAVGNMTYAVETSVIEKKGASEGKRTAATVGGGAALGGLIGAIAGKGKGAAIGAAVGAGAGTAVGVATKGQQIQIPSETKLDFTLKVPLSVTKYPSE